MALNLSKFFGAKPAQADSGDVSTVGEGTASANLLDADGKFGPETEAAVIDTSGPAVSPLEAENGGLDTTPEEPGFGDPVVGSAILYNGHANLGDNAIALDTWERRCDGYRPRRTGYHRTVIDPAAHRTAAAHA